MFCVRLRYINLILTLTFPTIVLSWLRSLSAIFEQSCKDSVCDVDDGVNVVVACDVSEFGCCPDGVTAALGHHHAGCPSK